VKKTVVFILSTPYAGSHFLSLLLGSNTRAKHIGEIKMLRKGRPSETQRECYFQFGEALEGIGPDNIEQIYDLIFARLDPKIEALIDTSKRIDGWADRFLDNDRFHRKYLHLIRDPRALVRRWMPSSTFNKRLSLRWRLMRTFPELTPAALTAGKPMLYYYNWLMQNRRITEFVRQYQLDSCVVTYRDLALNTASEVERLMQWIGVPFEPPQLEYWNFEHLGTQKRGYEWVKEKKINLFDVRWKTELPASLQDRIANHRRLKTYLDQINLTLTEDGLTRRS
jgi:hypothetical protein